MIPFYERSINIDTGNKCTLECSGCARQRYRKNGETIPGKDLTIEQFDKITNYFKKVSFCGTFSDPIFNPNFFDLLEMCKTKNIKVDINTAASHRPEAWYEKAFNTYKDAVWIFGIDGLPKDSHKYRVHQNGEYLFNIMLMAKYKGLCVKWQYIVFDYNKNDIEEAKMISKLHKIPFILLYTERDEHDKKIEQTLSNDINKINPKCLLTKRSLSLSNTGHLMPCCWLNTKYTQKGIVQLFKSEHHLDNNSNINDIINSNDWKNFFKVLKEDPKNAPFTCKSFCNTDIDQNPEGLEIEV